MMRPAAVTIPGGLVSGGQWYRDARLNPITGLEEEFLIEEGRWLSPAARVTELLTRCLDRLGPVQPVDVHTVRQLAVGDREALLLHLRRITLGDRLSCVLQCPACEKKMDLDLSVGDLLLPPYPHESHIHETSIDDGDSSYRVVFRTPNGGDQEAASALAAESVTTAEDLVFRRCVSRLATASGQEIESVPEAVRRVLPARMAELDPQAELLLDLACPECATQFVVPFDIADYFFSEIQTQEREFYRGVHWLSFHYHWGEDAILKLGRRKRQIYLELLADEISGSRRS
jgi:hypothetical protein